MKIKLLILFLMLQSICFSQQSPGLLSKVTAHMQSYKHKAAKIFRQKIAAYDKRELRRKYGHSVLKNLFVLPGVIRMKFPAGRSVDTIEPYSNFEKLEFGKRNGVFHAFIVFNDRLIATIETANAIDKIVIQKVFWGSDTDSAYHYSRKDFETYTKPGQYIHILLEGSGFLVLLDSKGNLFTTAPGCMGNSTLPECFMPFEEGFRKSIFTDLSEILKK